MSTAIFGLRFRSNADIHPANEVLSAFMATPRRGGKGARRDDFARYEQYTAMVRALEEGGDAAAGTLRRRIVLGALAHSHFFKHTLQSAVEQYAYHYDRLLQADLSKPAAFIRSAEEEIARLNPKKKEDQAKIERLRLLLERRGEDLAAATRRAQAHAEELRHIAEYVRDNLTRIRSLCEASITTLVGMHVTGEKTSELIEDVKEHFKNVVRDRLQAGPVTKEYVEALKADVAALSGRLSQLVLEDVYSATKVYETIFDFTKGVIAGIDGMLWQRSSRTKADPVADAQLFGRIEHVLLHLVAGFQFDLGPDTEPEPATDHDRILHEKRLEMLRHLFALLRRGPSGAAFPGLDLTGR